MRASKKTCAECPFSRETPKEYLDTKGQNGERFVGQAIAGFLLPCHMHPEFDQCRENLKDAVQCAGAAKYRANIGVAEYLPPYLSKQDEDHEQVFSTPAELIAHHRGTSVHDAEEFLKHWPAGLLASVEMQRGSITEQFIEREGGK